MSVKNKFRMFRRSDSSVYWIQDNYSGKQESLGTKDKIEAERLLNAKNEAARNPIIAFEIAKSYLKVTDSQIETRTWGDVMRAMLEDKKAEERKDESKSETRRRFENAIKDQALAHLHKLVVIRTTTDDFRKALNEGSVSTNVFLRRIHNYALGHKYLPAQIYGKYEWPPIEFKEKRAITKDEHRAIIAAEGNSERKAFYELAWHLGGSQKDIASLNAEDVDWEKKRIHYKRSKTKVDAFVRFGPEVERVLSDLPSSVRVLSCSYS